MEMEVKKIDVYKAFGKGFSVEAKHFYRKYDIVTPHAWCLYVNINYDHPFYKQASLCEDYGFDLGNKLYPNWHGGCTFFQKRGSYITIGCDYQHIWDEDYCFTETLPDIVKQDMQDLFDYFNTMYEKYKENPALIHSEEEPEHAIH